MVKYLLNIVSDIAIFVLKLQLTNLLNIFFIFIFRTVVPHDKI